MELSTSIDLIDEKEPFKTLFSGDLPQDGNPICCARENQTIVAVSTTAIIINKHEVEIEFDFPVSKICWDQGGQFALIADEGGNIHLLHSSGRIVLSQKLIQNPSDVQFQCISIFDNTEHTLMLACLTSGALIGVIQHKDDTENAPKRSVLRGVLPEAMRIFLPFVVREDETKLLALCVDTSGSACIAALGNLAQLDVSVISTLQYGVVEAPSLVNVCLLSSGSCHFAVVYDSVGSIDIFDVIACTLLKSFRLSSPLQCVVACDLVIVDINWSITLTCASVENGAISLRTIGLLSSTNCVFELSKCERAGSVNPVYVGYSGRTGSHLLEFSGMKFNVLFENNACIALSRLHAGLLQPVTTHMDGPALIGACLNSTGDIPCLCQHVIGMSPTDAVKAVQCLMMNDACSLTDIRFVATALCQKHAGATIKPLQILNAMQSAVSTALLLASLRHMSVAESKRIAAQCLSCHVRNTWMKYVSEGDLQIASILSNRHLRHILTARDCCAALLALPESVTANDCTQWVQSEVLPKLVQTIQLHHPRAEEYLVSACNFLISRAETTTDPQDAVMLSGLAVEISSLYLGENYNDTTARHVRTHEILTIHAAISIEWFCNMSYEEVKQGGIVAVLHAMLWSTDTHDLMSFLKQRASPTLLRFNQSMDTVLSNWIIDTTSTRVISYDVKNENDDDSVSYDRLAIVTSVIENAALRARSIMALYQVLTILRNSDTTRNLSALCMQLEEMAATIIDKVDTTTREALLEAAKLEKLRDTAAVYHITGFDIRDKRQIRSVISLIIAQTDSPTSVSDALSIVDTYSSYGIDVTSVLSKALVYRLLQPDVNYSRDSLTHQVIQYIPQSRTVPVFEDAVHNLLAQLEEQRMEYLSSEAIDNGKLLNDIAKSNYVQALLGATLLTSIFCDELKPSLSNLGHTHLSHTLHTDLLLQLKKLRILQSEFDLYLKVDDFGNEKLCGAFVKQYVEKHVDELLHQGICLAEQISAAMRPLRRLCSALEQSLTTALQIMVKRALQKGNMDAALTIASFITSDATTLDVTESAEEKVSPLNDTDNILQSARALGGVAARSLAEHAIMGTISSQTVLPFTVSSKIVHKALERCSGERIAASLDILYSCDLVSAICNRLDTATESEMPASMFQVDGTSYMRDGILLSAGDIINPLLRHILCEVQRRQSASQDFIVSDLMADDLEKFVALLQQSENHLLVLRILLSSWDNNCITSKMVRMSTVALIRKILSYREIDTRLAVALLSSLPYELMVRELKASAPSIQSDFSRLQIIASIGEELARMWEREELLLVFQSLQTNARWWHLLTEKGVKVDPKAFQNTGSPQRDAVIRAVVPDLLEHTGGDLALATDYCSQFGIEAHFASRCYMEMQLLQSPIAFSDSSWAYRVRTTATTIEETRVLSTLRKILTKMHSLDYEKIRYVCTWLLNALTEQDILEECLADASADGNTADIRTNVAAEAEAYRKYLNLSSFLITVPLGVNIHTLIPSLAKEYVGVPKEYQYRIPLWQLLEDPWGILEPIIAAFPETSARVSPLCDLLHLDRDEFASKRVMAHYSFMREKENSSIFSPTSAMHDIADMILHIHSALQQINIWRWIFEKEKHLNGEIAQQALQNALTTAKGITDDDIEGVVHELEEEMIMMRCKILLAGLQWSEEDTCLLVPSLYDPMLLLRELLRVCIEKCWKTHIHSVGFGTHVLCIHDICHVSLTKSALKIVDAVCPVLCDVWKLYNQSEGFAAKMQPLETIRLDIISKLLADVESSEGLSTKSSGWDSSGWSSGENSTKLTSAEYRRRDDYFQGYAIAVLVRACADGASQESYVAQMLQLVDGQSRAPPTRLITARSRFRAAIACTLLASDICCNDVSMDYISNQRSYLCCMAEMRYLRLTCSDESLLSAIRGSDITPPNPSPLVSTWLRDEGLYSDVCELARDVLLAAQWNDIKIWRTLLHHMFQYGHRGALVHTLTICRGHSFFEFLISPAGGLNVVKELHSYAAACLDKIEQMLNYLSCRSVQESSNGIVTIFSNFGITALHEEHVPRAVVLSGSSTLAIGKWEDPLEDMTLAVRRLHKLVHFSLIDFSSDILLRFVATTLHKVVFEGRLSSDENTVVVELLSSLEDLAIAVIGTNAIQIEYDALFQRVITSFPVDPKDSVRPVRLLCHIIRVSDNRALSALQEYCRINNANRQLIIAFSHTLDRTMARDDVTQRILSQLSTSSCMPVDDEIFNQAWNNIQKMRLG